MKPFPILPIVLLLSACQGGNPYQAASVPIAPAPDIPAGQLDRSAYPAAPRDYAAFRTWSWTGTQNSDSSWASPDLLREAVANGLEQQGLRPAATGATGDLRVSANLRSERRVRQVNDYGPSYGGYYGYGRGPYWGDRYGVGTSIPITRNYEVRVGVLQLDFHDASGQSVWSASRELASNEDSAERREALYEAVKELLQDYPPD